MRNVLIIIALLTPPVIAQAANPVSHLTSNNILALAGGGDTLWLATERGFNYRTPVTSGNTRTGWPGFEVSDLGDRFWYMAFGGGVAAALVYNSSSTAQDYIGFWQYNHQTRQTRERYFRFSDGLRNENDERLPPAGGMIYAAENFWTPFGKGGMARYNPDANSVRAMRPGDASDSDPSSMEVDRSGDSSKIVLSLANYKDADGSEGILVTTPKTLWVYYPAKPAGDKWEALHNGAPAVTFGGASAGETFASFDAAFTLFKKDAPPTLYSVMTVRRGDTVYTSLYSYTAASGSWFRALNDRSRFSIFPAGNSAVYILSNNRVSLFADTLSGGSGRDNHLREILTHDAFRKMLDDAEGEPEPNPLIQDVFFMPGGGNGEEEGALAVAASSGLYLCESAGPLAGEYAPFKFFNHERSVKEGEAYALPGIMRASHDGRYDRSVFVYRLKKDGNVTIRIYDYNMSLVKTAVRGERRAADERSTVPARDFWDGTTQGGRRASPGVYYFRITSTGGDRFFGKVVLAK